MIRKKYNYFLYKIIQKQNTMTHKKGRKPLCMPLAYTLNNKHIHRLSLCGTEIETALDALFKKSYIYYACVLEFFLRAVRYMGCAYELGVMVMFIL